MIIGGTIASENIVSEMVSSDTIWENFGNAIIVQAAKDWRKAMEKLRKNPDNEAALKTIKEVEKFFCSDWYGELTTVPGDKLLAMLREEADNEY